MFATALTATIALLLLAGCGQEMSSPAPGNGASNGAGTESNCGTDQDFVITVVFKEDENGNFCPDSVSAPEPEPGVSKCNPTTPPGPNCVPRETNSHATRIYWKADQPDIEFRLYFDPLVGPKHKSANGCVRGVIAGSAPGIDDIPPGPKDDYTQYKYTIAKVDNSGSPKLDPNCKSLDPDVWIER